MIRAARTTTMKIAVLTPLPPIRSGIAHYSAMILPELARRHDVTAVVDQTEVSFDGCRVIRYADFEPHASSFDAVICQIGNNVHHEFVWNHARHNPSVVVLHEIVLHHLLVETTLARGDADAFRAALIAEYGEIGAEVAKARIAGLHGEVANFLLPASGRLAEASRHVIVHNEWAVRRLREEGVTTPATVVSHPFTAPPPVDAEAVKRLIGDAGWSDARRVIGVFGFVTAAKRPEVVLKAFGRAVTEDPKLRLVFVGEPAPDIDLEAIAEASGVPEGTWRATGYVNDHEFDVWMNAVDRVVSLRYPTAGESSGPIVRAFAVGRPVAVSDYAQFAELPAELVARIPFDDECEAVARFMLDEDVDPVAVGHAQREWLRETSTVEKTVDGYERALESSEPRRERMVVRERIPILPRIEASIETVRAEGRGSTVTIRLSNRGASTIECALWGQPCYLLHATRVSRDGSIRSSTHRLPGDLGAGDSTTIELSCSSEDVERIEFRHAMSGTPGLRQDPFAVLELPR